MITDGSCRSGWGRTVRVRGEDDPEDGTPGPQHAQMEDAGGHSLLVHRLLPPPAQRRRRAEQARRPAIRRAHPARNQRSAGRVFSFMHSGETTIAPNRADIVPDVEQGRTAWISGPRRSPRPSPPPSPEKSAPQISTRLAPTVYIRYAYVRVPAPGDDVVAFSIARFRHSASIFQCNALVLTTCIEVVGYDQP